jgi:hypothetical protein
MTKAGAPKVVFLLSLIDDWGMDQREAFADATTAVAYFEKSLRSDAEQGYFHPHPMEGEVDPDCPREDIAAIVRWFERNHYWPYSDHLRWQLEELAVLKEVP